MEGFIDFLKAVFYGAVEGVTEWLPVSSTGHLILFENIWPLNVSEEFQSMFRVVVQMGAILAVIAEYFKLLNPWARSKDAEARKETYALWLKVIVGCFPAGVVGLLFHDFTEEHLSGWPVVAAALIIYGIAFIIVEKRNESRKVRVKSLKSMTLGMALCIGGFQVLSIIPGTSRSGSSILGAMIMGVSRKAAAEFSFLLAIPVVCGYSLVKLYKFFGEYGFSFSGVEILTLVTGMLTAFAVAMAAVRFLVKYIKTHDFKVFGIYRIVLGAVVIAYFLLRG